MNVDRQPCDTCLFASNCQCIAKNSEGIKAITACSAYVNICGVSIARLQELARAEQEGRLLVLPCKVGDTVWAYDDVFNQIAPYQVDMVELYGRKGMSFCSNWRKNGELMADLDFDVDDIGKTVFLTRTEAEAALAKEGASND